MIVLPFGRRNIPNCMRARLGGAIPFASIQVQRHEQQARRGPIKVAETLVSLGHCISSTQGWNESDAPSRLQMEMPVSLICMLQNCMYVETAANAYNEYKAIMNRFCIADPTKGILAQID